LGEHIESEISSQNAAFVPWFIVLHGQDRESKKSFSFTVCTTMVNIGPVRDLVIGKRTKRDAEDEGAPPDTEAELVSLNPNLVLVCMGSLQFYQCLWQHSGYIYPCSSVAFAPRLEN
jgi:hypothetical protein